MATYHQRLSVNLNRESSEILQKYTAARGVTLTEAIRRAIFLFGNLENARAQGNDLVLRDPSGGLSTINLLH